MPKVLIIDDEIDLAEITQTLLTKKGYQTEISSGWENALKKLETFQPQVILLDVFLNGIDGLEICKQLKSMPNTKHIPVIVMSAFPQVAEKATTSEYEADDFISKPFEINDLTEKLYSVLIPKAN